MATQLQFRRGTTAQNNSYTGLVGEISLDTSTNNIRIHDGSTAGGAEIIPAGTIVGYGAGSAPTGWLLCDDTAVSRTTYARLFAVIGTGYGGGDGSGTFNVPDLRDKVPLGKGANNDTLGTTTGSAAASSVLASTSKTGVTTAAASSVLASTSKTGVTTAAANTGTANTGTGNTGTGTTGTGTSGNSTATTTAANTGTANTGTGNTGTGNTGADGDGDLTLTTYTVNQTLSAGTKDVTQVGLVTAVNQASHSHSIPALSVPALSVPALTIPSLTVNNHTHSVPGLSIPALSVPALSIPALTVPSLTVNAFSVNTTLPTEVVNYIIKI